MKCCWKYMLFFVFGITCVADGAEFRCDYKYSSHSKAWFKYHVIPVVWQDARLMCALEGAILASPTTPEIRATMKKSIGISPIFSGLHSTLTKGEYFTVDGVSLDDIQHKWANFQPDNIHNNESCIALDSQGEFFDVSCYEPRPFICYRNITEKINECGTHDPAYQLDTRTGHCYKFHTIPRHFRRAHFACAAEGGHLAIINSEVEANVLRDLFAKYPASSMLGNFYKDVAYIGFYNWGWGEDGDWRTIHGQTLKEAGYDKWSAAEPDNSTMGEYCGSIFRTALLNDLWCEKPFTFICEKRPDYPPVCDNHVDVNLNRRNYEQVIDMLKAGRQHPLIG